MKNIIDKICNTSKYHTLLLWLYLAVAFPLFYYIWTKLDFGVGYNMLVELVVLFLYYYLENKTKRWAIICLMAIIAIMVILLLLIVFRLS